MKYVLSETAVSKLRGALSAKYGNDSRPYYSPASISPDAYPPPFAVRWAQSESSGQGAWVVWLPTDTSAGPLDTPLKLLMVGSRYIDFLSGTGSLPSAATLPFGWRILANDANGGRIYLNILRPLSNAASSTIVAGIETTARQPPQGEEDKFHVYSILIAEATTNADSGAKYVRQFIDSAITIPDFGQTDPGGGGGGEDTDAPLPYEVRFDKDLASGGAWKIYLPTEHLLLYNGEYIDTSNFDGVTSIGDGWYSFDEIGKTATHVWLVITDSGEESGSGDSPATVEISATKGEPAAGEEVENICIAELSYTANGGDSDPTVEVWQSAVGALIVDKKPGAVSTPFQYTVTPGEQSDTRQIENCVFFFNGEQKTLANYSNVPQSGTVYLTGTQAAKQEGATEEPPWQFAMATTPATAPTGGKVMNVRLYDFSGGKVSMDYRTTFLTLSAGSKGDKGDSASVAITTSSYTPTGGGSGMGVTFQPKKNGQADGDSSGLGIEVEEDQPTTGDPGGITLTLQRSKNGQAEGNPVSVTIKNGAKGDPGSLTGSVVFLHDVTWDASNHTLVKHWASLNLATGVVTDASTPTGKTAAISTTPISSLLPSESGGGS